MAARVRMTMVEGTGAPGDTEATFVAEAETDADGLAELAVLAGSALAPRTYVAEIVPAADARSASSFVSLEVGPDDVTLPSLLLPLRSALAGRLVGGDVRAFLDTRIGPGCGGLVVAVTGLSLVVLFARFLYRRGIFLRV